MRNAVRTFVAVIVAVNTLSHGSQGESPTGTEGDWETNWESFVDTIQTSIESTDLLSESPVTYEIGSFVMPLGGPTMSGLISKIEGKTVTWTGSISGLPDDWGDPHIDLTMPAKPVKLKDGSSGICNSLRLNPGLDQISQWKSAKVGDCVRFKTVLKRGEKFPVVGVFLGKDKEKGKAVVIISTYRAELVEVLPNKTPATVSTGERKSEATKTAEQGKKEAGASGEPPVTRRVSSKGIKDHIEVSPPLTVWCVFEGIRLRNKPDPSEAGECALHEAQKVLTTGKVGDVWRIKTETDEGWMHCAAFAKSKELANRIASYSPRPNALFVAREFTGPSNFQLQIWHGGLKVQSVQIEGAQTSPREQSETPRLQPGNCLYLAAPGENEYSGPFNVFGNPITSEKVGTFLILDNARGLVNPISGKYTGRRSVLVAVALTVLAALIVGAIACRRVVRSRRRQ